VENFFLECPIFICAWEPSGDLYANLFIKRIRKNTGISFKKSNAQIIYSYYSLNTLGFFAGFSSSLQNYRMYKKICQKINEIKPKTFVAVSYPGVNLLLCRYAKKLGARVIYLLPPQIWVWGEFRKYFIKKWTDLVISVFPFEYYFYNCQGIKTIYWQNPLFEELKRYKRVDFNKRIGFMPGSRKGEIKRNLPVLIEIIENVQKFLKFRVKDIEYALILHPDSITDVEFKNLKQKFQFFDFNIITKDRHQAMCNCDLLITCSGTASLEAAIMGIPQIFFNRPSFLDYHLFRHFLKIKEFNLANLYFGKRIVPSFVMRNKKILVKGIKETLSTKLSLCFYLLTSSKMYNQEHQAFL